MKNLFTVSQAAKLSGLTAETLRHYDRIGLVKPCEVDPSSGYRFYSQGELVRLSVIQALRTMDLSLGEIKKVLEYDDLEQIIAVLRNAEARADEKIAELERSKERLRRARADYEGKLPGRQEAMESYERELPQRTILLSETMEEPTLDNLWNYLRHFYRQIPEKDRESFTFEDTAAVYTQGGESRLFAVCTQYKDIPGIKLLPAGKYLCASCGEAERREVLDRLLARTGGEPAFIVEKIIVTGILQWRYEIQVPIFTS